MSMGEPSWLADSPIIAAGSERIWERYAGLASRKEYAKGTLVFEAGEPADSFYYIESGRTKIFHARLDGLERILTISEWGNTVGTSSCFEGALRWASCRTLAETVLLAFRRADIVATMASNPELVSIVLAAMARKQRGLTLQAHATTLLRPRTRVALLLCHLSAAYGERSDGDGGTRLKMRMSTESLAAVLGMSRATLSRELSRFVLDGIIRKSKWDIVVLDYEKLHTLIS
jgi:CRP/FNR family transcriptional regulator, cyclic AMP receptor protein